MGIVALSCYREQWNALRIKLQRIYDFHQNDAIGSPSVLAQQLLISGEDHRFFTHGGIDLFAIGRAAWRTLRGHPEGASTIEMQVVRVVSGRYERSVMRKFQEMALATLVTRVVPKAALPAIYLRIGYYGWRMIGLNAACHRQHIDARFLSPVAAAELVARLKYPEPQTLSSHRQHQIERRARHLLRLHYRHQRGAIYFGLAENRYAVI
jgi:membrane carboxypeptidase/penicillin-binding protein PbpC